MAILGYYFITNMLHATGWPRKQGLLKKEVVNTMVLDSVKDQMVDWAAAIGAGRPNLALQVIALYYTDRDLSPRGDAPDIRQFIEGERSRVSNGLSAPHALAQPIRFRKYGETVPANVLEDPNVRKMIEEDFMYGLLYGLGNPKRYEAWYKADLEDFR